MTGPRRAPRSRPDPPPAWAAEVARVLSATPTGERSGLRATLAQDIGRNRAAGTPVDHRIALLHAGGLPASSRDVLGAPLAADRGRAPGPPVRHELVDAPVGPAAPDQEGRIAERTVRQAHAVLVAVSYPVLVAAARGVQTGARLGAEPRALRRILPTALAAVGEERTAVVVLGADAQGVGTRAQLRDWSAAAVRRVLGEPGAALTVVPVMPEHAAAARTPRERTAAGLTELADRVLGPWTESAADAVDRLARHRYTSALRSARQGFARMADAGPAASPPDPDRLLDPAYTAELHARFIAASCRPLTTLALRAVKEESW
ncbi:hypothetical protein ACFV0T_15130 [Streptomyces sp. NPDC059582]|uniref:hypothetical protein n=1 Tax=Streptomyces sp. NPDC059582 TaxID=3346875 RepID=UPI0036D1BB42